MKEAKITFRVDTALKIEFAKAAEAIGCSSAQLLRSFMGEFIRQTQTSASYEVWFRNEVQRAIESATRGGLASNEDVEARFARRRNATRGLTS
ncbi:hypothetical protein [Luteimonas sp. TWI1437]|uniref:hypothetical protein n=1 Tax=unclassified Luteimonas TaxID=2629088 RepID=UPI003208AB69